MNYIPLKAIVFLTIFSIAISSSSTSTPTPIVEPPIAYFSGGVMFNEIYVMNADVSSLVKLTNNTDFDISPDCSPEGQKIAFMSNRANAIMKIYVANAYGSNLTCLTDNQADDSEPDLSADRQKIAFVTNRDGNKQIRLTNNQTWDHGPSWCQ